MYFADFQDLIRRNQASNAFITYYRDPDVAPNKISIFDRNLIHRNPDALAETGYYEEDHWRDSKVCDVAFFNGEIPLEGFTPKIEDGKLVGEPYRGALSALTILLNEGCLRRTSDELRDFFNRNKRPFPKPAV